MVDQRVSSCLIFFQTYGLTIFILQTLGAVREAGGNFSKKQKAEEDQYFRRQQQEQLKKMKEAEAEAAKQGSKKQ